MKDRTDITAAAERKFAGAALSTVQGDGTFSGYASLFGVADLGRDIVDAGAFAATLARAGAAGVRMLYQHDPAEPIGAWTEIREDARGLFVRGRLELRTRRGREVHALMRGGALDGLSIGFRTVRSRRDARTGHRHIVEADLQEISIVTFPMLPGARVEAVKGRPRASAQDAASRPARDLARSIRAAAALIRSSTRTERP